jgi:glycosyltransferase involved in cell wall biosynthesis
LAEEWKLKNFSYLPSVSQEEFKNILCEIDIGLFSLAKHHTIHNFPGKLLGYMVQSIPILGSVNEGNDLMPLVNNAGAGFISVNGEDEILFENAKLLLENVDLRKKIGQNGHQLLKNEFDVQKIAEQIVESVLKEGS